MIGLKTGKRRFSQKDGGRESLNSDQRDGRRCAKTERGREANTFGLYFAVASWNNLPTATVHQPKMAKNSEINHR
jgi:hypothetical protein